MSLALVRGIHWSPVTSPHKGPVTVSIWWHHHGDLKMKMSMTSVLNWHRSNFSDHSGYGLSQWLSPYPEWSLNFHGNIGALQKSWNIWFHYIYICISEWAKFNVTGAMALTKPAYLCNCIDFSIINMSLSSWFRVHELENCKYYMILDALPSNIEYTGRRKAILDEVEGKSNIAFLCPVYSILDGKAYNIWYIIHYILNIKQI